ASTTASSCSHAEKASVGPPRAAGPYTGGARTVLSGGRGAVAERRLDRLRLAVALDRQRDGLTDLVGRDQRSELRRVRDPGAVERDDHVTDLQPCLLRGGAALDRRDLDAAVVRGVRRNQAEQGVLSAAGRDQLRRDRLDEVRGDRETDALVAAAVALDLRRDADHVALHVEQRATRVAMVDRGVGLDRAVDRRLLRVGRRDLAA